MTNNIDPRFRAMIAALERLQAWRTADDTKPIVLRFRDGSEVTVRNGLPKERLRANCPTGTCGYVRCVNHLWLQRGEERAGRRVQGRTPDTTLRALTREYNAPPASCTLNEAADAAERGELMSIADVGQRMNLRDSQVFALQQSGIAKLKALGVDLESLMMGGDR